MSQITSVRLEAIMKKVTERNRELASYDFKPMRMVHVKLDDGSEFTFASAFVEEIEDYIALYAEHYPPIAFAKDEVELCEVYDKEIVYMYMPDSSCGCAGDCDCK